MSSFYESLTNRAKIVLTLASKMALRLKHNYVGTEHLLLALAELDHGIASNVLKSYKLEFDTLLKEVERFTGLGSDLSVAGQPALTSMMKKLLEYAYDEAQTLGHTYVGTEHLLLGLLRLNEGVAIQILESLGIDIQGMRESVEEELRNFNLNIPGTSPLSPPSSPASPNLNPSNKQATESAKSSSGKTPVLQTYGQDLTEMAKNGELDPVIGRESEIEWITMILCRRRKNNPVLVGEAGVGKTAVVEGLALMIAKGQVPELLLNKRVISLDLSSMVAGTKYRGQFEERIKSMMEELKKNSNIILFIDELHTLVGAGAAEGAIDAANILKPALARGEIQCIGATTHAEYRKNIEKDPALERRFQKLTVRPPTVDETILILSGLKAKYELHHKVVYTQDALRAASVQSERYVTSRFLPDKAIDLIDEAGAKKRMLSRRQPTEIKAIEEEIGKSKKEKEIAISKQEYELAASIRDQEKRLIEKQKTILKEWQRSKDEAQLIVDEDDILDILSTMTGIPLTKLTESEHEKILAMEATLKKWVIGQDGAIDRICKALVRSKADIKDERRPIGSFLFLGPTGVGKTHLAKSLATYVYGTADALIHVDMSEYMEKHTVSRLVGAPPGYVGHEEGGQLTEKVRLRPYCVLLFDEIEKAHHDVSNILLQILEEGHLTDSMGRKVDFKNTIIILTSNLGSEQFARRSDLGFSGYQTELPDEAIKGGVLKAAQSFFRPELLNRLDDQIVFFPFKKHDLDKIVDIEIGKLHKRAIKKCLFLQADSAVRAFLIKKGYSPQYGARPLRRAIERYLEEPLAELIIKTRPTSIIKVNAILKEDETIDFVQEEIPEDDSILELVNKKS